MRGVLLDALVRADSITRFAWCLYCMPQNVERQILSVPTSISQVLAKRFISVIPHIYGIQTASLAGRQSP